MIEVKKISELIPGDLVFIYNKFLCILLSKKTNTVKSLTIPSYETTGYELTCLWPTTLVKTTFHSGNKDIQVLK
jgi:hypothetical protein